MHGLLDIPVTVHYADINEQTVTDNVRALLSEINSMLSELINESKTNSIDLRSLPLLPGEYDAIKTILGEGEVNASFNSLGPSHIYETSLAGVWWVNHDNENGDRVAEVIEITRFPELLKSQQHEIEIAQTALAQQLEEWSENSQSKQ